MRDDSLKICGIICEYNPFHSGHRHHLEQARALSGCGAVVAVMSGCFVQRGEPAALHPLQRAREAVLHGADLVLELPTAFSVSAAPDFAYYGIKLLRELGAESVCFGSECGDIQALQEAAADDSILAYLSAELSSGASFAKAACRHPLLQTPNNILAIEYLRAIRSMDAPIRPISVERAGNYHSNGFEGPYASATAIRGDGENGYEIAAPFVSREMLAALRSAPHPNLNTLFCLLKYRLRTVPLHRLRETNGMGEGLENRLLRCSRECVGYEAFLARIACKRYPLPKLKRLLLNILLDIDKIAVQNAKVFPPYFRVLAVRRSFLPQLRRMEPSLIMTNEDVSRISDRSTLALFEVDRLAWELYNILTEQTVPFLPPKPQIID